MASLPIPSAEVSHEGAEGEERHRQKLENALGAVLQDLQRMTNDAMQKRTNVEERWLADLRQFHGVYDRDIATTLSEKSDDARSGLFINITRPKTNAWSARLGDMLFPNDDKNWGIDPTPVPELTRAAKEAAQQADEAAGEAQAAVDENNAQIDEAGQADPALAEKANAAVQRVSDLREAEKQAQRELAEARRRAKLMEDEIDDQLTESNYPARCRDVIDDMVKLGVGILKGPIVREGRRRKWTQVPRDDDDPNSSGRTEYELANDNGATPSYRRVNPWHFFPDPGAENIHDAEYVMERHLPNKKKLRKMARELGFIDGAVRKLIKEGPGRATARGDSNLNYLAELRGLEAGGTGEDLEALSDRYVVWEFYGALEIEQIATMIRAMGRNEDADNFEKDADPLVEMTVRIFFCDNVLLKIEEDYLLDSGDCLYSVATFEKGEASILGGIGVPRIMRNEQAMLNSAVRMMMDNAALAVGPQVVVDKEQIAPENGSWKLGPRKIWQWIKTAGKLDDKRKPFETFDIPMNQALLAAIIDMTMKFVDEAVAMPLIAQGEQGQHVTRTAQGMSMLFNAANVVFRRVVKNWDDDLTAPTIRRAFDFNMQFSDKEEIKGDMKVEARGTSVLLVREMQAEQLLNIIDRFSTHPILGVALKAFECMRLVLQALSINPADVMLDREDYLAKVKQMEEAASEGGGSPEEIRAQTQLQIAQLDAQNRLEVAGLNERIQDKRLQAEMLKLAASRDIGLEEIRAMLAAKQMDNDSKERSLAAEISLERENAREAKAQGLVPTGSGGAISMGGEQR